MRRKVTSRETDRDTVVGLWRPGEGRDGNFKVGHETGGQLNLSQRVDKGRAEGLAADLASTEEGEHPAVSESVGLRHGLIGPDAAIAGTDRSGELDLGGGEGGKDSASGAKPVGKGAVVPHTGGVVDGSFLEKLGIVGSRRVGFVEGRALH